MESISYDILEAMVQCFGKSFHYKDGMAAFLLTAGVPRSLVDRYRTEHKFVWGRKLLTELGQTDAGAIAQRKLLMALCQLRNLPDKDVPDRDAGLQALRSLKQLAIEQQLIIEDQLRFDTDRATRAKERATLVKERAAKLEALRTIFSQAVMSANRQSAGYTLQDLLQEVFRLYELEYRKSFRNPKNTQEIDGHFQFQSFDYLVEAKWRQDQPTEPEIGAFKYKVDGKITGTRGLFISVSGFRSEVVSQFDEHGSSIILMDGMDLIHVLEGRIDLRDGLRSKIEAAAQKGAVLTPML